jgi:hypothetical protein
MLKKSLLLVLLGCCTVAQAEYHELTATYTGFADYNTGVFDPARTATLHALVDDVNGDGKFTVDEVREFSFPHVSIYASDIETYGRCGSADQSSWCLEAFSYTGGNSLTFDAWSHRTDFEASSGSIATSGDVAYSYFQYTSGEGSTSYSGFRWTPETTLAITVTPPVPEPSPYAMLGAGLCAIGVVARRRRKQ